MQVWPGLLLHASAQLEVLAQLLEEPPRAALSPWVVAEGAEDVAREAVVEVLAGPGEALFRHLLLLAFRLLEAQAFLVDSAEVQPEASVFSVEALRRSGLLFPRSMGGLLFPHTATWVAALLRKEALVEAGLVQAWVRARMQPQSSSVRLRPTAEGLLAADLVAILRLTTCG